MSPKLRCQSIIVMNCVIDGEPIAHSEKEKLTDEQVIEEILYIQKNYNEEDINDSEYESQITKIENEAKENESVQNIVKLFPNDMEADALISKRKDVSSGNVAQTENAMQNILLEEMEKLDGIMFATTNLCDNIVRKCEMNEIISGKKPDYDRLAELCKEERLVHVGERHMGFCV